MTWFSFCKIVALEKIIDHKVVNGFELLCNCVVNVQVKLPQHCKIHN